MRKVPTKNFASFPKDNIIQILLLLIFATIMFFIRTIPIHHLVFTDWPGEYGKFVNFAADDAVYHMRLVHNTIHHFPWRVFFDPFTHFPFGNQIHFGPLFTLIIATISLIAGLGHPTPELINIIGAYIPVIMGILCLIPVYFIARRLFGKTAAIITAFILTFLPGEFLQRSSLGFTDHHVAEVLFSTITCAFLMYALKAVKTTYFKPIFKLGVSAGIAFGLFILVWPAALMFGGIFLIFFVSQLTIDHLKNRQTEYLLTLAATIYITPAIMVLPYALINPHLELMYYSLTQPLILIIMTAIFVVCYTTHLLCKKNQLTKDLYSLALATILIFAGFILYRYAPKCFALIQDGCKLLFEPTPGMKTISEVHPSILNQDGDKYTIMQLWQSYFWTMLLAIIGFGHLCYRAYKDTDPAEVLLLTWSIIIILATIVQCRFNYYLAINAAILAGCYGVYPFINFLNDTNPKQRLYLKLQKVAIYTVFCIFITYPIILILLLYKNIPSGIQVPRERYNTFMWLKTHTPDPQGKIINKNFSYTAGIYPIPKNPSLPYKYPKSAYGIMSWWEIGHQITYIAERIPNTNPFQAGIVEKNNTIGAAPFFISNNEEKAVENLNTMGSRYILIDNKTASDIWGIGIWCNDTKDWNKLITTRITLLPKKQKLIVPVDSTRFLQSMMNRLYYNDANGLKHFRLIHESDGDYWITLRGAIFKPHFYTKTILLPFKNYDTAVKNVNEINRIMWANKEKIVLTYYARPPTKVIKIFEKVKGAVVRGKVSKDIKNNTEINITLKLKTKFNRIFTYQQTAKINNGKYKFIVPYPTTAMHGDNYSYDIKPMGNYQIQIDSKIIEVFVTEDAVMLGKDIRVDDL